MIDLTKGSVISRVPPPRWFQGLALGLPLFAVWFPVEGTDPYHAWRLVGGLIMGAMLIALLGVVVAPNKRVRTAVGAPASGAMRLCLGANMVVGLIALALGFAGVWVADIVHKVHIFMIRRQLIPSALILLCCAAFIEYKWVAARLTRRVVGLHVLAALSLLVFAVVANLRLPAPMPWADLVALASAVLFSALMAVYLHKHRPRKRHCRVCDYDLTGNVSGRCPECGTPIAAGTEAAAPPGPAEVKKTE